MQPPVCWCGGTEYRSILLGTWARGGQDQTFAVVECVGCQLARTVPVPDEARYGRGESIWARTGEGDAYSERIASMIFRPGARLLDIGCSVGNLVAAAERLGMYAEGIDIDPVALARGRELGRNVHQRSLDSQGGVWNIITLNHVLEHITDLSGTFAQIRRLVAPRGQVLIQVPYFRGWVPRLMGDHWFAWAPDEHVWHFTPQTLLAVARSAGFEPIDVQQRGQIEPPSRGVKGIMKHIVAVAARRFNHGDEIEALFRPA